MKLHASSAVRSFSTGLGILALLATTNLSSPGADLDVSTDMALDAGVYTYDAVVIRANATLTLRGDPVAGTGVRLNADSLIVETDGVISATGQGYPLNQGPGANPDPNFGPSHGGRGGRADYATAYGSAIRPLTLGSGANNTWGNNGSGGGAIHLVVNGIAQIDGRIEANAHGGWTAAGGSILLEVGSFSGSGSLQVHGGRGACPSCSGTFPGGAGGRIAVHYDTANTFTGTAEARGGPNSKGTYTGLHGDDGTVGFFDTSNPAQIRFQAGPSWRFQANDAIAGEVVFHDITLVDSTALIEPGVTARAISQFNMSRSAPEQVSTLGIFADSGSLAVAAGDFNLGEGCVIEMDGKGFPLNQGPGSNPDPNFGPSHGGRGGRADYSAAYGSAIRPVTLGSGANNTWGNDGSGGGAVHLVVAGIAQIDGAIHASAHLGWTGAGGSILIDTGTLAGTGSLSANGGRGACPSCTATFPGGAGGRIAVHYDTASTFSGSAVARGGANSKGTYSGLHGDDGTVGFFDVSDPAQVKLTTGPSWHFEENNAVDGETVFYDITLIDTVATVAPGVRLRAENAFSMTRTLAPLESRLSLAGEIGTITVTASDAEIGEGCVIEVDGKGYPAGQGPGASAPVTGAGHGGRGGDYFGPGGPTYGSARKPIAFGSSSEDEIGGIGGGALRLIVEDSLTLDGTLSADAIGGNSGGSSGGSIWVDTRRIEGAGTMSADGARAGCSACSPGRGGGGGGRIAIHHAEDAFSGLSEARGGPDNWGNYPPTGAAEDGTVLWIREIPITIGAAVTIQHDPLAHYTFLLDWGGSQNEDTVLVRLTPMGASGSWSLLGELGQPPGPGQNSWRGTLTQSGTTYEMLVPLREAGPYYFDVFNEAFGAAGGSFTMEVLDAQRYVLSENLGKGSNAGSATISISGAGFETGMRVQLRAPGGALLREFAPATFDHTSMTFAADLTGLSAQVADLAVIWPDNDEQVLAAAFEITGDPPGLLEVSTSLPRLGRSLRKYTMWVTARNAGFTDIAVPVLKVSADTDLAMRLSPVDPYIRRPLLVVPVRDRAPFDVLPPGAEVVFPVQFFSEGGTHARTRFSVEQIRESGETVNWGTYAPGWQPAGLSAGAWAQIWSNFTARMGTTQAQLADRLRSDAVYLTSHENPTRDVYRLFDLEFSDASANTGQLEPMFSERDDFTPGDSEGSLNFVRFHSNTLYARSELGAFGLGWSHNFDLRLIQVEPERIQVRYPNGTYRLFFLSPKGVWQPLRRDHGILREVAGGFEMQDGGKIRHFDSAGFLTRISRPDGVSMDLVYSGDKLSRIDHSNGESLTFNYTGDLVTGLINHASEAIQYQYTGDRLSSVIHPGGNLSNYTYFTSGPEINAIATFEQPGGPEIRCTYDLQGRLASTSCEGLQPVTITYPSVGTVQSTDALSGVRTGSFDGDELPLTLVNPDAQVFSLRYRDEEGYHQLKLPNRSKVTLRFDAFGNPVELIGPSGSSLEMELSPLTRQLRWFEDALGLRRQFAYNPDRTLQRVTYPDSSTRQFEYDANQRVDAVVNRRGQRLDLTRDTKGRITQKDIQGGPSIILSRDSFGRINGVTDPLGTTSFTYDPAGLLTGADYPGTHDLTYTPDQAGRRERIEDSGGFSIDYTYDDCGRLTDLRTGTGALLVSYTYDDAGRLSREDRGNGTATVYVHTPGNRLQSITHLAPGGATVESYTYTYNPNGKCTSATNLAGETTDYRYDAAGRLKRVDYDNGDFEAFTYDEAGNRQAYASQSASHSYATNSVHGYASVDGQALTHDPDGNLTDDGARQFVYDVEGLLTRVVETSGPTTWDFAYDGLGRRRSVSDGATTTSYLNDPTGIGWVAAEIDGANQVQARYIHGLGLAAMIDAGGNVFYYGYDRSGNTRLLTDAAGSVANRYSYLAYGSPTGVTESVANPYRYAGLHGVSTEPAGLLYMRNRYYDPGLGRFVSPDPIGLRGGPHPYTYANNDPVNLFDPDGLGWLGDILIDGTIDYVADQGKIPQPGLDKLQDMNTAGNVGREFFGGEDYNLFSPTDRSNAEEGLKDAVKDIIKDTIGILTGDTIIDVIKDSTKDVIVEEVIKPNIPKPKPVLDPSVFDTLDDPNLFEIVAPGDPNEKTGSIVAQKRLYLEPGEDDAILYTIYFENNPDIATAPAQEVVIEDQLDASLDWSSLRLTEISWGEYSVSLPANASSSFQTRFTISDYRPDVDKLWWVDISSEIDSSGKVTWFLQTLDPETGELPEDALAGFLPVNDETDRGQGQISFTIRPQAGLALGTSISNSASIVFDTEAPISTNAVLFPVGPPPASPLGVASLSIGNGQIIVSGSGIDTARDLLLEGSPDLENWTLLQTVAPSGTTMDLTFPYDENVPRYFVRLGQEE